MTLVRVRFRTLADVLSVIEIVIDQCPILSWYARQRWNVHHRFGLVVATEKRAEASAAPVPTS